jgi:membrane-associated protease RseP (regulator of RpoE activity)
VWLHFLLFALTVVSTTMVGASQYAAFLDDFQGSSALPMPVPALFLRGLWYSGTILAILGCHELGHYFACRYYDVDASLPFFIPVPFFLTGTMGAFIRIREPIPSKKMLFDIGIAGPIAGFVVACVVLAIALGLSRAAPQSTDALLIHYPLIFDLAHRGLASLGMLNEIAALPFRNLLLHPMAFAAWGGMFATSLNLLPGGQLDGGHILFSIAPRAHRTVSRLTILCLIPMAVYLWYGWLIWAILLELSSFRHPQVSEFPKVSGKRLALAAFALVMLVVTIIPKPIVLMEDGHDRTSLKSLVRSWRHK